MSDIWRAGLHLLIDLAVIAAIGLVMWRLTSAQWALGFVSGVLAGGVYYIRRGATPYMRWARRQGQRKDGQP